MKYDPNLGEIQLWLRQEQTKLVSSSAIIKVITDMAIKDTWTKSWRGQLARGPLDMRK